MRTEQEDEPNVRVTEVTCQETISQQRHERELKLLNESLILAQDERWRRA